MIVVKKLKVGKKYIRALLIPLQTKNFILLRGKKGYVMCGYLNLKVAGKFQDAAVKIAGVSTIEQALKTTVHSLTYPARRLGIYKGQPIKDVLKIIC